MAGPGARRRPSAWFTAADEWAVDMAVDTLDEWAVDTLVWLCLGCRHTCLAVSGL
jgi:hypothetical protein